MRRYLSHNLHLMKSAAVNKLKLLNDMSPVLFRLQVPDATMLF